VSERASAPFIYIVAGEPSGDVLGGRLMAALKEKTPGVRFAGIGGERMAAEGLASLVPLRDLAVMGFLEVLPHARKILRRIRETVADIEAKRPDIVVTIDSSGFTWRVARRLRGNGTKIPLVHYVAPMVWAWRAGRAREIAQRYDKLLALLPFEPPYFEKEGLACAYVGHPVIESGADRGDGAAFRAKHGIAADAPLLTMLPGSRRSEVKRLLPIFGATAALLARKHPSLRIVVPTVATVSESVREAALSWPGAPLIVEGEAERFAAFAASDVALAASGTVSLELAMAGLPSIITYRLNPLTLRVVRRMVRIEYANLVNLLLGREAVPEFVKNDGSPEVLAHAVGALLDDVGAREAQRSAYDDAMRKLGRGQMKPSARAADEILAMIAER